MTIYNTNAGNHVKMLVIDKEQHPFVFIANAVDGTSILLEKDKLVYRDQKEVFTYKKFFYYSEKPSEIKRIKTKVPVKGDLDVSYVV